MNIEEKLPTMTDAELTSLRGNAKRLGQAGTAKQQEAAERLLPLIAAEIAGRKPAPSETKAKSKPKRAKKA